MSMILEALSRAEKERQVEQGNHLDSSKYVTSSTIKEDRFKKWVLIALVANFLLIFLFASGYIWHTYTNQKSMNDVADAFSDDQGTANYIQPQQVVDPVVVDNQATEDSTGVSTDIDATTLQPQTEEPIERITNISAQKKYSKETSSLASEALVNEAKPQAPKAATKSTVASKTIAKKLPPVQYSAKPLSQDVSNSKKQSIAKQVATIQGTNRLNANNSVTSNYTNLNDMPVSQRAQLSELEVNVHVYDDNPLSRFVLINMVKYKEGDRLSNTNASISSIVPEGVVLNYANQQVLIERNK